MPDRKLILPGDPARPGGLTIAVPRGYETSQEAPTPVAVCRVPVGGGEVCGHPFYAHEDGWRRKWIAHMAACAKRHEAAIHAESPKQRLPILDDANWDPEVAAHMKKVGERMIREGRLEVLPSERAGF